MRERGGDGRRKIGRGRSPPRSYGRWRSAGRRSPLAQARGAWAPAQASLLVAWSASGHPWPAGPAPSGRPALGGRSAAVPSAKPARGGPNRASRPSARRPAALGALSAREWNSRAARAQNKSTLNNVALSSPITLGFRGIHAAKTTPLPPVENLWKTPNPVKSPYHFSTTFPQVFHKFSTSFPQP